MSQDGPQHREIDRDYLRYFGSVASRRPKCIELGYVILSKSDAFDSTLFDFCGCLHLSELKHSYYTS